MARDAKACLHLINAKEQFSSVLRCLERAERLDTGFIRSPHFSEDPSAKLQTTTEEVIIALDIKLQQLRKALQNVPIRDHCLLRLMQWYELRRGEYSVATLLAVSKVWEACLGNIVPVSVIDFQARCEWLYASTKCSGLTKSIGFNSQFLGPRLVKEPSPTPLRLAEDSAGSSHSSSSNTFESEDNSEDDITVTQEDEQWKRLCLPGMALSMLNTSSTSDKATTTAQVCKATLDAMREMAGLRSLDEKLFIAIENRYVLQVTQGEQINFDSLALPRRFLKQQQIPVPGSVGFTVLKTEQVALAKTIEMQVEDMKSQKNTWSERELQELVIAKMTGTILYETQTFEVPIEGRFTFSIQKITTEDQPESAPYAMLSSFSAPIIHFFHAPKCPIQIRESVHDQRLIEGEFNFQRLGIGGMGSQERTFFRRMIASRQIGKQMMKEFGVTHLRGILLYGPPGTGKTLIARKLSETLRARPPKIVNGPEVLDKFVGASEEKIRELFADAEEEQKLHGDNSMLHVIIFDEIDALCKVRGSHHDGTGVGDNIVNQLLSKLDGVSPLNNIMVIGMTNRLDLIDPAVLRPGRLELHIEVGLPDEQGRVEILRIHTATMKKHNRLPDDVHLEDIARRAKNFTGAELQGLVKAAVDFAIERGDHPIRLSQKDFENALDEVKAAHGQDEAVVKCEQLLTEQSKLARNTLLEKVNRFCANAKSGLLTVVVTGEEGVGKTTLALNVAKDSEFPCVKMICPSRLLGLSDSGKIQYILTSFSEAQKTPRSIVILDDLESLIDFVPLGNRYNANLLQVLHVKIAQSPPAGHKLVVLATAGSLETLRNFGLEARFQVRESVEMVSKPEFERVLRAKGVDCSSLVFRENKLTLRKVLGKSILASQKEIGLAY